MAELRRLLLNPKQLFILLMAAVVNLALFSGYCRADKEQDTAYYKSMQSYAFTQLSDERAARKQYIEIDYPEYLERVQSQTGAQSILGKLTAKSDFAVRSQKKTASDYSQLSGIVLRDGENRGILALKNDTVTDYLLLIAPILLVLELIACADSAFGDLTRAAKNGRVPLCAWRMLAVILTAGESVLLLYGGNLLFTCKFYGNPDFFRPVQSIPAYQVCAERLTVGGCLLAAAGLKMLAVSVISLTVWVILSRCHAIAGWSITAVMFGAAFLLNRLIAPTAKLNHLKFLNPFAALEADTFFMEYCNLNWFGYPAGFLGCMLLFCGIWLLIAAVLCLWLIGAAYPAKLGSRMEILKDRVSRFLTAHLPVHTLFGFEGWKLLIAERGLVLLLVTGLLGFSLWRDIRVYVPVNSVTEQFYSYYSGPVTQEKVERAARVVIGEINSIRRSRIRLAKAYLNDDPPNVVQWIQGNLSQSQYDLSLYRPLLNKMLDTARYTRKTGRPAWFIQENTYMVLFQESAAERRCCMVLLIFLILAFSGIRAYDNRYDTRILIRSTRKGRAGVLTAQTVWVMLIGAAAVTGLHGVYLLHLITDAGFSALEAPIQSIEMFRWVPFSITLRACLVLYMCLRFLAAMAVSAGIMVISRFSRTPQKALMLSMLVFLLPSALAESGIAQFQRLDFVHFLTCTLRQ